MQHLLTHFKELTVLPQNAEELKSLILQLAIQGKLTKTWREQNPDVEPASVLLERIKAEKEQLIKEKKIKKEKPLPAISEDNISDIPQNWNLCRMGDLFIRVSNGVSGKQNKDGDGYPVSRIETISNSSINMEKVGFCPNIPNDKLEYYRLIEGDILLSHINSDYHVGKTALVPSGIELYHGVNLILIRVSKNILAEYIDMVFNSLRLQGYFISIAQHAIGQSSINQTKIKSVLTKIPPLEEQKAIVSIVNQLFAEVEQLEAATKERVRLKGDYVTSALRRLTEGDTAQEWDALQAHFKTFFTETKNIKTLRESILQLAVQGKLTRKWREANPELIQGEHSAQALLERIKAEKAQLVADKEIKKEKPLPAIMEDEIPYALPEGWEWCRLKDLGYITGGGTPSKSKSVYWDGNIPWVSPKDMKSDIIDSTQDYVTKQGVDNSSAKMIPEGSLLIVGRSGILKRTIPVSINAIACTVNQDMKVIVPFITSMNKYIMKGLKGMENRLLKHFVKYGMTVHSLKYAEFELLAFPLPSLEEQKVIVQKVDAFMALCDRLEKVIETQKSTQEQWMKSCLNQTLKTDKVVSNV